MAKISKYLIMIGEGAIDLITVIIVSVLVAKAQGDSALGIFSYFLSFYVLAGFVSQFGISKYCEREVAFALNYTQREKIYLRALKALLMTSLFCALLMLVFSGYYASLTRLDENIAAYIFIALTLIPQNINKIRIAFMNGTGRHEEAARFVIMKRVTFLVSVILLVSLEIPPSFLVIGFFLSEVFLLIRMTKKNKSFFPKGWNLRDGTGIIRQLSSGYEYLLSDETLNIFFYMDYLILGLFVRSEQMGIYAEAVILSRCFLLVPLSIRPIFRKYYCNLVSQNRYEDMAAFIKKSTAFLFYFQSIFALYILLHFPKFIGLLFNAVNEAADPFPAFAILLPGLLYYSSFVLQEPLYEAIDSMPSIRRLIISVSLVNLILNVYFIPFAGILGAAFATTGSMIFYFYLFGRNIIEDLRFNKIIYIYAGAALYVIYTILEYSNTGLILTIFLVPILISVFFTSINMFYHGKAHTR